MLARAALALVALLFVPTAGGHDAAEAHPARLVVLYASDGAGPMEIFAADPAGRSRVGQVTFGRPREACRWAAACGFSDPMPSPDGRRLAFWSAGLSFQPRTLWLARIDGRGRRQIAAATAAEWSADSKRLFYWAADGIHAVTMSGVDRLLSRGAPSPPGEAQGQGVLASALSADGRTGAYATRAGIFVAPARGGGARLVYAFGPADLSPWPPQPFELVFSPNSHVLAATLSQALVILDLRKHTARLVPGHVQDLAWSPDGRRLMYVQRSDDSDGSSIATGDVRTVTPDGHVRVVVSRAAPYGGQIVAAAWAAPPRTVRFRPPEQVDGVFAGGPVQKLAADGDRVAYASCGGVSVWDERTSVTATIQATGRCQAPYSRSGRVATLALADDRVLFWWSAYTGLGFSWSMDEATLGAAPVEVATGFGTLGSTPNDGAGTAVGAGSLLVMSTWTIGSDNGTRAVERQTIERVNPAGCPCTALSSGTSPSTPLDVDQGRIVVSSPTDTRILDRDGATLLSLPVPTLAAQLDGSQLVLATGSEFRVYDAQTGALEATWPLADGPVGHDCDLFGDPSCDLGQPTARLTLEDVSHGLAAYIDAGQVHLLRLSDGTDRIAGDGTLARFTTAGLAYADGARIRLEPYDELPLH
jgi:hypothetical protein